MNDKLIAKIRKEVGKTGFPLELRIADFLNSRSYHVAHSIYYIDEDEKKSREVDLRVLKNFEIHEINNKKVKAWVRHCFCIECKKSKNPWVFLSSPKNSYDPDYDKIPNLPKREFLEKSHLDIIKKKHPMGNTNSVGRSYFEAFKCSSQGIFKAITTAVKSTLYNIDKEFASGDLSICYYYPLIILEGDLFQCVLNNKRLEIEKVDSVFLSFLYESKNRENSKFIIPIISESEVQKFFSKMDKVLDFIGNVAKNNPSKAFPTFTK